MQNLVSESKGIGGAVLFVASTYQLFDICVNKDTDITISANPFIENKKQ